jgi:hypothetical protein
MIDYVYVKETEDIDLTTSFNEVSDHDFITVSVPAENIETKVFFQKKIVIDWRRFSTPLMCSTMSEFLQEVPVCQSARELDRELTIAIISSMNRVIPKRVIHIRRDTDVVSYKIEALKKKRDRMFKQARAENSASKMMVVKKLNKKIRKTVKSERDRIINNKLKDSSASTFWKTVNGFFGRGVYHDEPLVTDNDGNGLSCDDSAEAFAQFFIEKVRGLLSQSAPLLPARRTKYEAIDPFTRDEIRHALGTFKPKKSAGPDEIPLIILKECYPLLEPYIHELFLFIVQSGSFPESWKLAKIKPIHKKGDYSKIENYRPISNLNSISKLFERCILNRLEGLDTDGPNQHGFKKGHSTTTAAIEIQSRIASVLQDGRHCAIYSMDLSAAFDLIRPEIFVDKALKVIPSEGLVHLIHDFITDRKGYVEIGQSSSQMKRFESGCPQGSTLGPKVFNIYCNDLYNSVGEGYLVSYADDSYVIVDAASHDELLQKTVETMNQHLTWLRDNGMICNVEKTEFMVVNPPKVGSLSITVDGREIKSQPNIKVLGILFDDALSWLPHVQRTITKSNRMFHGLKLIRKYLSLKQASQVMTSFYYSILYYGAELWLHRNVSFSIKRMIRSAHYRALRLIYGNLKRDELDKIGKRATPDEWSDYIIAKMAAGIVLRQTPVRLFLDVISNSVTERRQENRLFFSDNSYKKVGRQCFKNRLQVVSRQMKFDWLSLKPENLRPYLKKCFFSYAKLKM